MKSHPQSDNIVLVLMVILVTSKPIICQIHRFWSIVGSMNDPICYFISKYHLLLTSVSNIRCIQQKQKGIEHVSYSQDTRYCTLYPRNRMCCVHFSEEICTFLLIYRKLFSISKASFSYTHKRF